MAYSFSRDRTAELRDSDANEESFGPRRTPTGFLGRSGTPRSASTFSAESDQRINDDYEHEAFDMRSVQRSPPRLDSLDDYFHEVDLLKGEIGIVSDNVDKIERFHTSALVSFNDQQSREISRDLSAIKRETQRRNLDIKDRIKALELSNTKIGNTSDVQMRRSQVAALRKRFLETIQRYQDVERTYDQKYRQRVERQIRIVKPEATQAEVDQIIDSDDAPQIFSQSLMHAGRTSQARAVLSEVQTRHDDIRRIERTILELHQLFQDMSMLVEQQGEVLNQVEGHAETTAANIKEGNTMLDRAIHYARATRHKKWICFFLAIGICVMIAILVWWFGFGHPGADGSSTHDDDRTTTTTVTASSSSTPAGQ